MEKTEWKCCAEDEVTHQSVWKRFNLTTAVNMANHIFKVFVFQLNITESKHFTESTFCSNQMLLSLNHLHAHSMFYPRS